MSPPRAAAPISALLASDHPLTWVFAGDSVTQGAAHTLGWRDYTELVKERIGWEMGRKRDVFINTAVSGWRCGDFEADLDRSALRYHPDVIFVMFGLNDATAGDGGVTPFAADYERVLRKLCDATTGHVVVQVPNPAISSEADLGSLPFYVDAIRQLANRLNLPTVDHADAWSTHLLPRGPLEQWIGSGCHPNEYGHRMIARTLLETVGAWDPQSPTGRLLIP